MSPDLSFQKRAWEAVRAVAGPGPSIPTHPAIDEALPYTFIGESQVEDHPIGHEMWLTVHTWSKSQGTDEVKALQGVVRTALHGLNFTRDEWKFTCCREEYATAILDPDRETWHGVQRFRVLAS
jgi:hypothetical protein